ncbi:MAG: hypothetical protein ACYTF1_07585, partial [Planctomycetota bacterium]
GKGASLVVEEHPFQVFEARSDELGVLIENYDERLGSAGVSRTGTVFDEEFISPNRKGGVLLPTYNLGKVSGRDLCPLFEQLYNAHVQDNWIPNFMWWPFPLGDYFRAHKPLADAFEQKHGVSLSSILSVICTLWARMACVCRETKGKEIFRYWGRAYDGPYKYDNIIDEIRVFLPSATTHLDLGLAPESVDIESCILFLTLRPDTKSDIDTWYPGPHSVFLPFGERFIIDYAWINRRLFDLFHGIHITDQNFKGAALEEILRYKGSALPAGQCKAADGTSKQIDAAFKQGNLLIIVESKAVTRSIGFDRGDFQAIRYRQNVIEKALREVDDKARWLADHPVGSNYSITDVRWIMPIAVTPFVEFVPSLEPYYWIHKGLPRILTPMELKRTLEKNMISRDEPSSNVVPVRLGEKQGQVGK